MIGKALQAFLILGIFVSAQGFMPSRCFWIGSKKMMTCRLARLHRYMKDVEFPADTEKISLHNNDMVNAGAIKRQIQDLKNLKELDISYNKIESGIRDLTTGNPALEVYAIRNNLLLSINDKTFQPNPLLKRIDLSNNKLTGVPSKLFSTNLQLTVVELWANDLRSVPEELFKNNKQIEVINLSWNSLSDIPETFFRGLYNLKKVMLWKNQLTCLYSSMFQDNINLQAFHAAINHIKAVPDGLFENTPQLEDVRFWSNNLECIPRETFKNNDKLDYVNFLLGNEGLDYQLQQRFSNRGRISINKMATTLGRYGSESCTAPPCEWNPETFTMDCSHRNLEDISMLVDVCEKVKNLNLNDNALNDPELLVPVLEHMTEVRSLQVKDNGLKGGLNPRMFKANLDLTSVDLSHNQLDNVPGELFEANSILKKVNFEDNVIQVIPSNLLVNNPELSELDISRNKLQQLPKDVFSKSRLLTSIKISNNKLIKIEEDSFKNNEKLRELDLADNQLEGEIYSMTFEHAPDLERVLLKGNRISNITKYGKGGVMQPKVVELIMSYNKMDSFPVAMIEVRPNLVRLILDHNRISVIPKKALHSSKELREIDLSYNRLTDLDLDTFAGNEKLEILRLGHNGLKRLEAGLIGNNINLLYFSANGNKINFIDGDFFFNNTLLEDVSLSDNNLAAIPETLFQGSLGLRFMTISKNQLDDIPAESFDNNLILQHVLLHGNPLTQLPGPEEGEPGNWESVTPTEGSSEGLGKHDNRSPQPFAPLESSVNNYIGYEPMKVLRNALERKKKLAKKVEEGVGA